MTENDRYGNYGSRRKYLARTLSSNQEEEIAKSYVLGDSIRKIAKLNDISTNRIYKIVDKYEKEKEIKIARRGGPKSILNKKFLPVVYQPQINFSEGDQEKIVISRPSLYPVADIEAAESYQTPKIGKSIDNKVDSNEPIKISKYLSGKNVRRAGYIAAGIALISAVGGYLLTRNGSKDEETKITYVAPDNIPKKQTHPIISRRSPYEDGIHLSRKTAEEVEYDNFIATDEGQAAFDRALHLPNGIETFKMFTHLRYIAKTAKLGDKFNQFVESGKTLRNYLTKFSVPSKESTPLPESVAKVSLNEHREEVKGANSLTSTFLEALYSSTVGAINLKTDILIRDTPEQFLDQNSDYRINDGEFPKITALIRKEVFEGNYDVALALANRPKPNLRDMGFRNSPLQAQLDKSIDDLIKNHATIDQIKVVYDNFVSASEKKSVEKWEEMKLKLTKDGHAYVIPMLERAFPTSIARPGIEIAGLDLILDKIEEGKLPPRVALH